MVNKAAIVKLAKKHKWYCIDYQDNIGMLSFRRDEIRINIYTTTMTVATCLNHPAKGKTQLFRKKVTNKQLETIFDKPQLQIEPR